MKLLDQYPNIRSHADMIGLWDAGWDGRDKGKLIELVGKFLDESVETGDPTESALKAELARLVESTATITQVYCINCEAEDITIVPETGRFYCMVCETEWDPAKAAKERHYSKADVEAWVEAQTETEAEPDTAERLSELELMSDEELVEELAQYRHDTEFGDGLEREYAMNGSATFGWGTDLREATRWDLLGELLGMDPP